MTRIKGNYRRGSFIKKCNALPKQINSHLVIALLPVLFIALDYRVYQSIVFLFLQQKHMLCVPQRMLTRRNQKIINMFGFFAEKKKIMNIFWLKKGTLTKLGIFDIRTNQVYSIKRVS